MIKIPGVDLWPLYMHAPTHIYKHTRARKYLPKDTHMRFGENEY